MLIVAMAIGRTIFGLSIFGVYFICQPIAVWLLNRVPYFNSQNLPEMRLSKGRKILYIILMTIVIAMIVGIPFYGPLIQDYLLNTLKLDPTDTLNSIRSFLGISPQY
jgi:hypothetical protein